MLATCPAYNSPWAWGDPSHTRVLQSENLVFLDQSEYVRQVGKTSMSDFRFIYKADFQCVHHQTANNSYSFIVEAIKPSRFQEVKLL